MAGNLKGRRVLMVIAPEGFRDEELEVPKQILEERGAHVTVASTSMRECQGMLGATCKPDILLKDAKPENFDSIVVVGGQGSPKYLWENSELHNLLRSFDDKRKLVTSICLSPAALARAGVLRGRRATVFKTRESLRELEIGGAEFVDRDVVISDRIVTANGPAAARKFGEALAERLAQL